VYLDSAATSWPKPRSVYKEMLKSIKKYGANPGRSGHKMSIKASEKIYECRENLCKLFNISNTTCISFTLNTTEALNMGIKGVLSPGDHVIITSMEHNSVLRPLKKLEKAGVSLSIVNADKNGTLNVNDINKSISEKTKLIVTTHASNVIGSIMPIIEIGNIAKKHGLIYMVDAAQTAGLFPIDVNDMNIDMLAFPGHKGLLGPQGVGGIYAREGLLLDTIKEGGTGSLSESQYQPDILPDRYESGTLNTPGIVGLNEGVKYILKSGVSQINYHEKLLTKYMIEGLSCIKNVIIYGSMNLEQRVGVISINVLGKDCIEVCTELDETYNIAARGGLHCSYLTHKTMDTLKSGTIRFSIGCFNTKKDIERALKAINTIAKS
jgi:cysteine desulfurase family protein